MGRGTDPWCPAPATAPRHPVSIRRIAASLPPTPPAWRTLLDRLTVGSVIADRSGTVVYANDAVATLLGWRPEDLVGRPVSALVPERLRRAHAQGFGQWADGTNPAVDGRYLRLQATTPDGDEVPIGMVLSSVVGPEGEELVVSMMRPRDAPQEAVNAVALELLGVMSADRRVDDAIGLLLKAIGERLDWDVADLWVMDPERDELRVLGQWSTDPAGLDAFLKACRGVTLRPAEGLPGRVWASGLPITIDRIDASSLLLRQAEAEAAGLITAFAFPVEHDDLLVGVIELFRARPEPIAGEHVAVLTEIGTQLGRHLDRARRHERRQRAERRQRLVTEGIERLGRWLDEPAPFDEVCALLVPDIADACVIDLVEDGHLERLGHAFLDPRYEADVEALGSLVPLELVSAGPMRVIRTGETLVYDDVDADTLAAGLGPEVPRELVERLAPTSTIISALVGRGTVVGTLTLTRQGGSYDDEDRRFAEELGRHVGLAVANAHLYERERAVARALQQSLLPPTLPEVPGLEVAARYEPGGSHLAVGGDFYDLFAVADGVWYAVVGDVCGTGAEAAAITSQVRYTARALASRVDGPATLLDEINTALLERGDTRFCTAQVARLQPTDGDGGMAVTFSNGGHPPPVLVSRSGTRLVACAGTLLGVYPDTTHREVELILAPGEALALYTDGVIETRDRHGALLGEDRLVEVLDACVEENAEKTADQLIQAAVEHAEFGPADDIVVLVLRNA